MAEPISCSIKITAHIFGAENTISLITTANHRLAATAPSLSKNRCADRGMGQVGRHALLSCFQLFPQIGRSIRRDYQLGHVTWIDDDAIFRGQPKKELSSIHLENIARQIAM